MARVLEGYSPEKVYYFFEEISKIPRNSYEEQKITDYLLDFAAQRGLKAVRDEHLNVVIEKPATPGYENRPKVILQGHTDMICVKRPDVEHDFTKDPIELVVDGDYVRANGTTLGADDGNAVALMLALLDDDSFPHTAFQAVFTSAEEVSMMGAKNIDPHLLDGKYLIGLDYSQDRNILVGCAGISIHALTLPAAKAPLADPGQKAAVKISLSGLTGGHGGGDIIHYRANAIRLFAELLYALQEEVPFEVASVFAGEKNNSIPVNGELVLCYSRENGERVAAALGRIRDALQGEYAETDPGLSLVWEEAALPQACYDAETTGRLMQMMDLLPNGPFNFIDKARKFCKCSSNLGVLKEIDGGLYFTDTVRANSTYQNTQAHRRIAATAALCGASHECISYLPPWEYQRDSSFAKAVAKIWEPVKGYRPEENIIHATVETGLLIEKMHACGNTAAQGINLGVHNIDVHTFNERMELATLGKTFEVLRAVLEQIEE